MIFGECQLFSSDWSGHWSPRIAVIQQRGENEADAIGGHAPVMWRKERATWETEEEYRWVSDLWGKGKGVDGTVTTYNILTLSDDKTKPIGKNVTLLYTKTKYCGNKMGFWIGHFGMGMLDIGLPCEGLWIWSSFSVMIHSIYIKV